ncbi:hypothetical protein KVV02_007306 [Mortierella alpina]|uniref:Endonuclease/exonuclease/phosphatase domain-containing protein n=1 Tax=Mortierella alpina TaxID=64518 RepID=A0A9P8A7W4_MORAP|nr:hypothetical protein KVV02_007306 [Mortierella alpina]
MDEQTCTQISVLTLNCWGLYSRHKKHRIRAIGAHLLDPSTHGYDIVGLQEVWAHADFVVLQDLTKDVFPYAKHWTSGLFGSGLVMLSRHPILSTSLRRFALNGDPMAIHRGDWWDGKGCASVVLAHPTVGEIEVFNTHLHATYHEAGTQDPYLGCRLVQAWEMAALFRTASALGRHVIALGDLNSAPNTLVIKLLTQFAGLTDSWDSLHPVPLLDSSPLTGLGPEQSQSLLGITCDTPLNSWTSDSHWKNALTGDPSLAPCPVINMQNQQHLQQQQLDWHQTLPTEERLVQIKRLSDALKSLSPSVADRKLLELAETFENVTFQRSPNKVDRVLEGNLQEAAADPHSDIGTAVADSRGSSIVGSPQSQVPSPQSQVPSPQSQVPSPQSQVPSPQQQHHGAIHLV